MGLDGFGKGGAGRAMAGDEGLVKNEDGRLRREEVVGLDIPEIGKVIGVGAEKMNGDRPDAVLAEEIDEAHLAGDALENEIAAAEIEKGCEALLDLRLDEGGQPFTDIAVIGGGGCCDPFEIVGEG